MVKKIYDRYEISAQFPGGGWQQVLFREFEATLTSESRPFPCIFGVAGLKTNQLRFAFPDLLDAKSIADALHEFLPNARAFGLNTSLVVFSRPGPVRALQHYRSQFWATMRGLAEIDPTAWPTDVPESLDSPGWEFCFAGEPIFVVCNTPAHVLRQSRRSTSFMLTFQPRWVFDNIASRGAAMQMSVAKVRERLRPYDLIAASPSLGTYGDSENREFAQYFLDDSNEPARCPFHTLVEKKEQAA